MSDIDFVWFVGASLLLIIAPGPDVLFLLAQGMARGRRAGLATASGLALGNLGHTLAAALGASVIFRSSPLAFDGLKYAGAAYLLWLAWKTWQSRHEMLSVDAAPPAAGNLFLRGLLMNILNPKVALFFLAFLPQFVVAEAGQPGLQMGLLGVIFTLLTWLVFGLIGLFAGSLGAGLRRRPRLGRHIGWLTSAVFVALALRLASASA